MTFGSNGSCEEIVPRLSGEHRDSYTAKVCVYAAGSWKVNLQKGSECKHTFQRQSEFRMQVQVNTHTMPTVRLKKEIGLVSHEDKPYNGGLQAGFQKRGFVQMQKLRR